MRCTLGVPVASGQFAPSWTSAVLVTWPPHNCCQRPRSRAVAVSVSDVTGPLVFLLRGIIQSVFPLRVVFTNTLHSTATTGPPVLVGSIQGGADSDNVIYMGINRAEE